MIYHASGQDSAETVAKGELRNRRTKSASTRKAKAVRVDEEREVIDDSAETLRCTTIVKAPQSQTATAGTERAASGSALNPY